jgi:membrane-bound lytic murein transglycosylase D
LIESGFRTQAVSRAGAVGPWQFIRRTGQHYGLRIDTYVDERRDPVKSTHAAARYLKDLYAMFGDWHLSLAAYNTGEGKIGRILGKGYADDFWQMSDRGYLYHETENYVPQFLAALHIAEEPQAYGFDPSEEEPAHYDLVTIRKPLALSTVAQLSGTSTDTIKELNPALHRGVVPPQGYAVRLPKGTKGTFEVALANLPPSYFTRANHTKIQARRGSRVGRKGSRHRGHVVAAGAAKHHVVAKAGGGHTAQVVRRSDPTVVASHRRGHSRIVD